MTVDGICAGKEIVNHCPMSMAELMEDTVLDTKKTKRDYKSNRNGTNKDMVLKNIIGARRRIQHMERVKKIKAG